MTVQSRTTLKGYFNTTDTPSEAQFADLIDSLAQPGEATGGSAATPQLLKDWTEGEAYELTAVTYDSDNVVSSATVKWPDGSAGTFTRTTKNSTWLAIDAYTITHVASLQTVTQSAVTRNSVGAVTTKPALTVAAT